MPKRKSRKTYNRSRKRMKTVAGTNYSKLGKAVAMAAGGTLGFIGKNVTGASLGMAAAGKAYDWSRKKVLKRVPRKVKARIPISRPNDMTVHSLGTIRMPGARAFIKGKTMATYSYRNINQWIVTNDYVNPKNGQGRQAVDWPEAILTRNMLIGDTSAARTERVRLADDLFKLNPFWDHVRLDATGPAPTFTPTGTLYPNFPPIGEVPTNQNLAVKGVDIKFSLLSMTTAPLLVTVYWVTPKYDTNDFPTDTWASAVDAYNYGQNASTNAAAIATTTVTPGGAAVDNWGENPYQYSQFKKMWRCLKKQEMVLQPGDQRHFKAYFKYNKLLNRKTFNEVREMGSLAGITVYPLVIARAGLVGIRNGDTGFSKEVSYGVPKVGIMVNTHYKFAALPRAQVSTSRIYKGHIEATTENLREINDEDAVQDVGFN